LEARLSKIRKTYRIVDGSEKAPAGAELPIYHVHGYIPNPSTRVRSGSVLAEPVFSEDTYHSLINEPSHWANVVQLNALRENVCLMIGLSMSDPNLRKLLDLMSRKREVPKHFAILKLISDQEFMNEPVPLGFPSSPGINALVAKHNKAIEIVLNQLGVNVVWVQTHSEIPGILSIIRQ
jgi:hypothetical protein